MNETTDQNNKSIYFKRKEKKIKKITERKKSEVAFVSAEFRAPWEITLDPTLLFASSDLPVGYLGTNHSQEPSFGFQWPA